MLGNSFCGNGRRGMKNYDRVLDRTEQIREIRLEANVDDHGEKIHLESVVPVRILFPAGISDVD